MERYKENFSGGAAVELRESSDGDNSFSFSRNEDISYLYQRIRNRNSRERSGSETSSIYEKDEQNFDTKNVIDLHSEGSFDSGRNEEEGAIIDIRREKRYNYGIATVYLIMFLLALSVFINQTVRIIDANATAASHDSERLRVEEVLQKRFDDLRLENERLLDRINILQSELIDVNKQQLEKIDAQIKKMYESSEEKDLLIHDMLLEKEVFYENVMRDKMLVDNEIKPINYMNYKFGTQMIKQWTSESYGGLAFNNIHSLDLLSPVYNWDNTMNWPCELEKGEGYCQIGVHFNNSIKLKDVIYNSICTEKKIEVFSLDEDNHELELLGSVSTEDDASCGDSYRKLHLLNGENISEDVDNLIFKVYPRDQGTGYLLVNSFVVN